MQINWSYHSKISYNIQYYFWNTFYLICRRFNVSTIQAGLGTQTRRLLVSVISWFHGIKKTIDSWFVSNGAAIKCLISLKKPKQTKLCDYFITHSYRKCQKLPRDLEAFHVKFGLLSFLWNISHIPVVTGAPLSHISRKYDSLHLSCLDQLQLVTLSGDTGPVVTSTVTKIFCHLHPGPITSASNYGDIRIQLREIKCMELVS
jgi:hypothetical protein